MYRDELGLSQRALLAKIEKQGGGLSKGGLSQLESDKGYPTLWSMRVVAKALNCTILIKPKEVYIEELLSLHDR